MNENDSDFYKMCLKAHGYKFFEDESDEGKSESDEESNSMKPPPVPYDDFKYRIVKINDHSSQTKENEGEIKCSLEDGRGKLNQNLFSEKPHYNCENKMTKAIDNTLHTSAVPNQGKCAMQSLHNETATYKTCEREVHMPMPNETKVSNKSLSSQANKTCANVLSSNSHKLPYNAPMISHDFKFEVTSTNKPNTKALIINEIGASKKKLTDDNTRTSDDRLLSYSNVSTNGNAKIVDRKTQVQTTNGTKLLEKNRLNNDDLESIESSSTRPPYGGLICGNVKALGNKTSIQEINEAKTSITNSLLDRDKNMKTQKMFSVRIPTEDYSETNSTMYNKRRLPTINVTQALLEYHSLEACRSVDLRFKRFQNKRQSIIKKTKKRFDICSIF